MAKWNRQEIRDLFADLDCHIGDSEQGGDWDIPGLMLFPKSNPEEWMSISPYHDPSYRTPEQLPRDDCEVHAIEVRTDGDCRGGCQTDNEDLAVLYAKVTARLRKLGFYIINHYDEIF